MALSKHRTIVLMVFFQIAFAASRVEAEVIRQELTVGENENAIALTRYAAEEGTGPRPAVLVLHGSGGFEAGPQAYENIAIAIANSGMDAYLVHYFGRDSKWPCHCWDAWTKTISGAMTAILRRPEASGRVGLLGFSLGGAVAIASARDRRVGAAVIFYGFVPDDDQRGQPDHLPPLLVLHGSADKNVALESGREIESLAHRLGGQADLVVYPDEGHRLSSWKEPAARDALGRTIAFFRTELIGR
jgi:carboxymethylenebutenolidase